MAGLMDTAQQQPAPPPGDAPPASGDPSRYTDEGDSNVSPEEQEQYSQFEQNYLKLIYAEGGEVQPGILDALKAPPGAPEGEGEAPPPHILALANTAVEITKTLDDSAREAGKPLSDAVLLEGGKSIVEELAEVAEAAGIHDYSEEEMTGAFATAMDMYRDKAIADGRTDEETLKGQFNELLTADQEGRLGEVLPGAPAQDASQQQEAV